MACLHRLVKAEHRRGNLKPTLLPWGAMAIDGKNVMTVHLPDMVQPTDLKDEEITFEKVAARFAEQFPQAQVCRPKEGAPYALVRVHTVTLISAKAAVCVHQRPIAGNTNESGSMPALLDELKEAYGKSSLFSMVTTDAGNTSCDIAGKTVSEGLDYFAQIKQTHGAIHDEAERTLKSRRKFRVHATYVDTQNGRVTEYHLWRYDLSDHGWLDWSHARQIVREKRTTTDKNTGEVKVGNRYYVTNKSTDALKPEEALTLCRSHWRCENNTHWTADAELMEDQRQPAWSLHPIGWLVVSALRMMALAILSVARMLSRFGYTEETPSWGQVSEHFLLA